MTRLLANVVVGRSKIVLVTLGLLTIVAGLIACQVRFDFTPQSLYDASDGIVRFAEEHKEQFGHEDALLLAIVQAVGTDDALAAKLLNWQSAVSTELKTLPHVDDVVSIASLEVPVLSLRDGFEFRPAPLIREFPVDDETEQAVRRRIAKLPSLQNTLLSADHRVTALLVKLAPEARTIELMQPAVHRVQEYFTSHAPPHGYAVHLTGLPLFRVDIVDSLRKDMSRLFPLAGFAFLVALVFIFRRLSSAIVPLIAVLSGLGWTIASIVLAGQSLNILSNVLPILILIVGVSNCVHVVSRYGEEAKLVPHDRATAARRTIRHMALACFLTFGTTAVGFGSLVAADSYALRTFAAQASVAMLCQYVCIMLILGALLSRLSPPVNTDDADVRRRMPGAGMSAVGSLIARSPRLIACVGAVVVVGALLSARNLSVNSQSLETYESDHPAIQTVRLVEDHLAGIMPLEVNLRAKDASAFLQPAVYRGIAQFQKSALEDRGVTLARSYVDLHQEVYANFRRNPALQEELPSDDAAGCRRIERSAWLIRKLADIVHYGAFVSEDGCEARILLRTRDLGTKKARVLIAGLEQKLAELLPPSTGIDFRITGDAALHALSMDSFVRDLFRSLLAATLIIFGLIAVLYRSLRVGLIAAVPNLTPLVVTLGYIGLRGYDLNTGNVVVFAISLGIAVDNTIHFLARFREEIKTANDTSAAVVRTLNGTGRAIVVTSVLMLSGFGLLLFSDFLPTRRFAELSMVTMSAALLGDLVILPASLILFWKRESTATVPWQEVANLRPVAAE